MTSFAPSFLRAALDELNGTPGVEYADARHERDRRERTTVRDGDVEHLGSDVSEGVGVRVLYRGAWGFAAAPVAAETPVSAEEAARDCARRALDLARAVNQISGGVKIRLCEVEPARGHYETPVVTDPFEVSAKDKVDYLVEAVRRARAPSPGAVDSRIKTAEASMRFRRIEKGFISTEGTDVSQRLSHGSVGLRVTAQDSSGQVQRRTFPQMDGGCLSRGYELLQDYDLQANAEQTREEALALLAAPSCPAGKRTLILESSQLALQIHESCGHPTESDRALGEEISLAGSSFLSPSLLGQGFRYGSPRVNLVADGTTATALGTSGWDDEGVAARKTPLVENGIFVGYLTSRETAARLGLQPAAAMRAESWSRTPIVRMVNINLEPDVAGPSLEELIADTADGIYLCTNRSWSIDDLRLNFQFGCEVAWEIKNGRRTRLLKNPVYTGRTNEFWAGCDAICRPDESRVWGFVTCGKGDPMQLLHVGDACPPARFQNVDLGGG